MSDDKRKNDDDPIRIDLGGLLGGVGDLSKLATRLNDLIEQAGEMADEIDIEDQDGKVRGKVGWRVSSLDHARQQSAHPRSTAPRQAAPRRARPTSEPVARPAQPDPLLDIMAEGYTLRVMLDMANANSIDDFSFTLEANSLNIVLNETHFSVTLPQAMQTIADATWNNGILEVILR